MCGIHQLDWVGDTVLGVLFSWEEGGGGQNPFATYVMTDQPTMQLTQVTMRKNIEYTLYLTIVLFTAKAGLTGSS